MSEDELVWEISPHTAAKHSILKKYIQAWAPILGQGPNNGRLIYIDGFAGPGEYKGGEDGSPIIVLKAIKEHKLSNNFKGTEFLNIFIEKNSKRAKNLEKAIEERVGTLPTWIKLEVINGEFNAKLKSILDEIKNAGGRLAPCFCFVDPFGWSDIDYDVLSNIMQYEKAELLITFMAGYVERFVFDPKHIPSLERLYSESQLENIKNSGKDENLVTKYFLENLKRKISDILPKSELFTISFSIYNSQNRLEYHLIYLTKNCKGLEVMKRAMLESAKDGSYTFRDFDFDPNQKTMIDYSQQKVWVDEASAECYNILLSKFGKNTNIPIDQVKNVITCYTKWVYNKDILVKLEESNKIRVIIERRKKGTYPDRGFIAIN